MRALPLLCLLACDPAEPTESQFDSASSDTLSDLPSDRWTFVPVDGMRCANGTSTGIGVHPGSSEELLFLFAGGGACWDALTCYVLESAVHVQTTWGADHLEAETSALAAHPLFDRSAPSNPFADATWIYVPYCTADLHFGDNIISHSSLQPDLHHVGDANVASLIERVTLDFPNPDQVHLIGISAGGYGVQLQADRFASAFPTAELALLADGAPMVRPYDGRWWEFRRGWTPRLPADCEACEQGFDEILAHQVATLPQMRFGLTTYLDDAVVMLYLNQPHGRLGRVTNDLLDEVYAAEHAAAYALPGDDHVMLVNYQSAQTSEGIRLEDWFATWASGQDFHTAR